MEQIKYVEGINIKDLDTDPSLDGNRLMFTADETTGKVYKAAIQDINSLNGGKITTISQNTNVTPTDSGYTWLWAGGTITMNITLSSWGAFNSLTIVNLTSGTKTINFSSDGNEVGFSLDGAANDTSGSVSLKQGDILFINMSAFNAQVTVTTLKADKTPDYKLTENNIANGTSLSPDPSYDINYMAKPTGDLTLSAPVSASLSRTQIVIADGNGVNFTVSGGYTFPEGNEAPTTLESGKRYEFTLYVYSGGDYKISWVKY